MLNTQTGHWSRKTVRLCDPDLLALV